MFDKVNPNDFLDDYVESRNIATASTATTVGFSKSRAVHQRKSSMDPHALPTTLTRRMTSLGGSNAAGGSRLRP